MTERQRWVMPAWMGPYLAHLNGSHRVADLINDETPVMNDTVKALHRASVGGQVALLERLHASGLLLPAPTRVALPLVQHPHPHQAAMQTAFGTAPHKDRAGLYTRRALDGTPGQAASLCARRALEDLALNDTTPAFNALAVIAQASTGDTPHA